MIDNLAPAYDFLAPPLAAAAIAYLPAITNRVPTLANPIHTLVIGVALELFTYIAIAFCPSKLKGKSKGYNFGYTVANAIVIPVSIYKIGFPATEKVFFAFSLGCVAKYAVDLLWVASKASKNDETGPLIFMN